MKNTFDVNKSSLEASVKTYHKKVIEPLLQHMVEDDSDYLAEILDKLITTDNIGEQSVNYAESAGSVDWSSIKNIPPDLSSSDPNFSTNHTHPNKAVLDSISEDDVSLISALKEEYAEWVVNNPDGSTKEFIEQLCNPQYWGEF